MNTINKSPRSKVLTLFKVGSVFNPVRTKLNRCYLKYKYVVLDYPSRLNAMAIDPSKIVMSKDFRYTPGEVIFSVPFFKRVSISVRHDQEIVISKSSKRHALIMHAVLLMKSALHFKDGLNVDVENSEELRHCGLGSSSGLLASVACAINEVYGNPVDKKTLIAYLAQNHGEEIDGDNFHLNPVQCIGGSAAAGLCKAGMIILSGESVPIATMRVPKTYSIIVGIPKDIRDADSRILMGKEKKNLYKFVATGRKYGKIIAYNILHRMLPAMVMRDLKAIGDVIYEYRFKMGSIKNCSFTYKNLPKLCKRLEYLKNDGIAEILSISSVGPGIFVITKQPKLCERAFRSERLKIYSWAVNNDGYKIVRRMKNG
ncbi:MAG: hypothetical protein Q7R98_03755 [Candidatus Jorgensenbacteria bacterium]|nr:hypothetical protein [Candidatus Jorgensenbacteria bacterium]